MEPHYVERIIPKRAPDGVFRFKDEILKEGIFPAAVEPDLWRRINAKLDGKHMPQRARALEEYYLTPRLFLRPLWCPNVWGNRLWGHVTWGEKCISLLSVRQSSENHSCKQKLVREEIVEMPSSVQ